MRWSLEGEVLALLDNVVEDHARTRRHVGRDGQELADIDRRHGGILTSE